ncbi:unnamed protein product, partial [Rotaria magnacalcarata]
MNEIQNDVNKNSLASDNNDNPSVFTSPIKDDQL